MKKDGDFFRLDSGRQLTPSQGVIGFRDGILYGGYDGHLYEDGGYGLTPDERVEIADFFIAEWERYRSNAWKEKAGAEFDAAIAGKETAVLPREIPSAPGIGKCTVCSEECAECHRRINAGG